MPILGLSYAVAKLRTLGDNSPLTGKATNCKFTLIMNKFYSKFFKWKIIIPSLMGLALFLFFFNKSLRLEVMDNLSSHGLPAIAYYRFRNPTEALITLYSDSSFTLKDYIYFFSKFYKGTYSIGKKKINFNYALDHRPDHELTIGEINDSMIKLFYIISYKRDDYLTPNGKLLNGVDSTLLHGLSPDRPMLIPHFPIFLLL